MQTYKCPNCGAPAKHSYNHQCEYCGTLFNFNEPKEKTIQMKPEDLVDINLVDVTVFPRKLSVILRFDGYKLEMPKVYEYNDKENYFISKMETYINPPKCGFCIELPIVEIQQRGLDYVMYMIESTGIRYNELNKIKHQVVEKLIDSRLLRRY